jgi:hypothetical protein
MKFVSEGSELWITPRETKRERQRRERGEGEVRNGGKERRAGSLQFLFSEGDTLTLGHLPPLLNTPSSSSAQPFGLLVGLDATKGRFQLHCSSLDSPSAAATPRHQGSLLSVRTPPLLTTLPIAPGTGPVLTLRATSGADLWSAISISFAPVPVPTDQRQSSKLPPSPYPCAAPVPEGLPLSDLHTTATETLFRMLPLLSSATTPEELLHHSRVVWVDKGAVLTTSHPSLPLWLVLSGQVRGRPFDTALGKDSFSSTSAGAGALLNGEGLLGAPAMVEWTTERDQTCLLEIDRSPFPSLSAHTWTETSSSAEASRAAPGCGTL